jgi:hypothetical protein
MTAPVPRAVYQSTTLFTPATRRVG